MLEIEEYTTEFVNNITLEKVTVYQINLPENKTVYKIRKFDKYGNLLKTEERTTREEYRIKAKEMLKERNI